MDGEKYTRQVRLFCPTCGGNTFEFEAGEPVEMVKCVSCEREMTRDELMRENGENISEHVQEMGKEVAEDAAKELKKALQKAFRGSKYIKIK